MPIPSRCIVLLLVLCLAACAPQADDATTPGQAAAVASGAAGPVPAEYSTSTVRGLYYMQKYWIATRNLEKAVWYFAPDGIAYFNPESGFGADDLVRVPSASKGPYQVTDGVLSVRWGDGQESSGPLEIVDGGFNWDTGMFLPVAPFADPAQLVGRYEGGSSMAFGSGSSIVVKSLELRADGSYSWEGSASVQTDGTRSGGQGTSSGRWQLAGHVLQLTAADGQVVRGISFPLDDETTPANPDRIYFAGVSYARQ